MKIVPSQLTHSLIAVAVVMLTACGGGGGGGSGGTPTKGTLVTGVAATGLAIQGGSVTLSCASGSTTPVKTAADGSYSVDVSGVSLPCVAKVDYTDATGNHRLHSLVRTAGNVNITPVTDMVVANLSSTGLASSVTANDVQGYTDSQISIATRQVETLLQSKGVNTANLPIDVIGTKFTATNGSTKGDSHDSVLDDIGNKLSSNGNTLSSNDLSNVESELHSSRGSSNLSTSTGLTGDAAAGKVSYDAMCSSCHGSGISDARNAAKTLEAVRKNEGGMGKLSVSQQVADNIATYLTYGVSASAGTNTTSPVNNVLTTQTITFTSPGQQSLGNSTVQLRATASSGLIVTFATTTPSVCVVSISTLKLVAAGNCTVTASQAGNTGYAAAPNQTVTFGVIDPNATSTPVTPPPAASTPTELIPVAATGKTLYAQCSGCHGPAAAGGAKVLNGANSALTILNAITTNMGGMRSLSSLTNQNLADLAAYLATPNI
jgi:mono/diheme cytochrome c family protein